MGKHTDAVKPLDEFRAPWETEAGTDAEIDKPKLRRFIYNLMLDKAKSQDSRDEALEAATAAEKERDDAKAEVAKASPEESNRKIERLEKERNELKDKVTKMEADKEYSELRADVLEGLDPKFAKYVTGTTRDELEKSLEAVKADFGISDDGDGDDDGDDDDGNVRTRPQRRSSSLVNPADKDSGKPGETAPDFDKLADGIFGSGPFG